MVNNEERLHTLPDPIRNIFRQLERDSIDRICTRIKKIGRLSASDTHALAALANTSDDVNAIKRDIANTLSLSEQEVQKLYYSTTKADYDANKEIFDKLGVPWVPFDENPQMLELVQTISSVTASSFVNIASTTGFVGDVSGAKRVPDAWKPLAKYYQDTVDYAILQVRTGVDDYNSVMRQTVRKLSDYGLSAVEYDNESKQYYRRRVDSSVRNALSGGLQRLSKAQAELVGAQIGADGMEISVHRGARPSHMLFQGLQFPMAQFTREIAPQLEEYNCYHRAFPVVLGVSTPAHSKGELAEFNARDRRLRAFEGRPYTTSEAAQKQRQLETAIRRQKDRAAAFGAAGDSVEESIALARAAALSQKYRQFSATMGLETENVRITAANFTRSQAARMGAITRNRNAIANLTGMTAVNGITIIPSTHIADQAVLRGVGASAMQDALTNPLNIGKIKVDSIGRPSQNFIGRGATVSVNPESGALVTVWQTGSRILKKYGGD